MFPEMMARNNFTHREICYCARVDNGFAHYRSVMCEYQYPVACWDDGISIVWEPGDYIMAHGMGISLA